MTRIGTIKWLFFGFYWNRWVSRYDYGMSKISEEFIRKNNYDLHILRYICICCSILILLGICHCFIAIVLKKLLFNYSVYVQQLAYNFFNFCISGHSTIRKTTNICNKEGTGIFDILSNKFGNYMQSQCAH